MPEPKPLSTYPLEYFQLFEKAASEEVVIHLRTNKEAKLYRNRLYAFKSAVILDPERAGKIALLIGLVKLRVVGADIIAEPSEPGPLKESINAALTDRSNTVGNTADTRSTGERTDTTTGEVASVRGQHDDSKRKIVHGEVQK